MAEENAKTAQRRASIAEDRATVSHKKSIIDEKRANVTEERATATEKRASVAEERAKVAEMEVIAAVMKATAADTRANGLEERTNQAEGEVKTLQESARISDIRMAELVQTNSCQLSDFGSSNFARQVGPGNYSYAAPKSSDRSLQSPKMDVFSYGILVLEMACGQFPEVQKRLDVMKRLQWSAMKTLIEQCSARSPGDRPNIADVLMKLPIA